MFNLGQSDPFLNRAQQLIMAIAEGGNSLRGYKAPHAYRGTPEKPRFSRRDRFLIQAGDAEEGTPDIVARPRLFKGHRP